MSDRLSLPNIFILWIRPFFHLIQVEFVILFADSSACFYYADSSAHLISCGLVCIVDSSTSWFLFSCGVLLVYFQSQDASQAFKTTPSSFKEGSQCGCSKWHVTKEVKAHGPAALHRRRWHIIIELWSSATRFSTRGYGSVGGKSCWRGHQATISPWHTSSTPCCTQCPVWGSTRIRSISPVHFRSSGCCCAELDKCCPVSIIRWAAGSSFSSTFSNVYIAKPPRWCSGFRQS